MVCQLCETRFYINNFIKEILTAENNLKFRDTFKINIDDKDELKTVSLKCDSKKIANENKIKSKN